ncbi:hypothetical protein BH10BDE1_BH10BDE1_11670 [soil metagenome]
MRKHLRCLTTLPVLLATSLALVILTSNSAHAQQRFEELVRGPFASPFDTSATATDLEPAKVKIEAALASLVQNEIALEQSRRSLSEHGFTAESFFLEVRRLAANGEFEKLTELVTGGKQQTAEFFVRLDSFIQDYLDVSMALGYHSARARLFELRDSGHSIKDHAQDFARLEKLKAKYLDNKNQYQQPKDTLRTTPYKSFFGVLQSIAARDTADPSLRRGIFARIKGLAEFTIRTASLMPSVIRMLKAVFLKQQPDADGVPLTRGVIEAVTKINEQRGGKVNVVGLENMPTTNDPNVINVIVASHRHGLNDQIALAALKLKSMVFFGAANNFLPNWMNLLFGFKTRTIRSLNENLGFIVVGSGASPAPLEKARTIVTKTGVRTFLIFPGGRLPEGWGATMGVREKTFSEEGLVAMFESMGFKVNLIPISMKNNARLFDNKQTLAENGEGNLEVRVHELIDDQTRRVIMKYGGKEALNMLLRFGLTEVLVTDQDLVWGQVRAGKILPTFDRFLKNEMATKYLSGAAAQCRDLFTSQ